MTEDDLDEESLRRLQAETARLPRDIEPPRGAWEAIRAEIDSSPHVAARAPMRVSYWQRPAFLAAAAMLLIVGSSTLTAIALGRRDASTRRAQGDSAVTQRETQAPRTAANTTPATLAEFTAVENEYIGTANRLSAMLESEDLQLAPETMAKLKESLRVIDNAILEARQALAQDPSNKALIDMLSTSYEQKVDLLKRTTEMGRS
jgi:hypothetical protein